MDEKYIITESELQELESDIDVPDNYGRTDYKEIIEKIRNRGANNYNSSLCVWIAEQENKYSELSNKYINGHDIESSFAFNMYNTRLELIRTIKNKFCNHTPKNPVRTDDWSNGDRCR